MTTSILWFRRDLRLADHPALAEAAGRGPVVGLFVLDPRLLGPARAPRVAFLFRCLRALDDSIGGRLVVRAGDPVDIVPTVAAETEADRVYGSWDAGPYGAKRDERVADALHAGDRSLSLLGSPYAVDPGSVSTNDNRPFQVFSPFYRAWTALGWPQPLTESLYAKWAQGPASEPIPVEPRVDAALPQGGEAAAMSRLDAFLERAADYHAQRDVPSADATSRLSPYLKYGCIHPRQVLARLDRSKAHEKYRQQLAWREFYADVLWHVPASARQSLQRSMARMKLDSGRRADERFLAWTQGRTGFPMVDAGMRQLLGEAWVHNRVRMIVASFLVKDLHVDWTRGARWFMENLVDGDLASNNHNWQWVAGTGTDPARYFRIFNPVTQGKEHDPEGDYVRRWVPELGGVAGAAVHEPWKLPGGLPRGYPERIVDHATERAEALARYTALKSRR